jgi:hypothetical protein
VKKHLLSLCPHRRRKELKLDFKKLALVAGFVGGLAVFYAFAPLSQSVNAAPTGAPVPSTVAPALNTPFTVTASWSDDQVASSAVLTATKSGAIGSMSACTITANSDGQTATIAAGTPSDTCTVTDDLDSLVEVTTLSATYTCTTAGSVTFVVAEGGSTSASVVVNCGGSTVGQILVSFAAAQTCGPVNVQAFATSTSGLPVPDGTLVNFLIPQGGGVISPAQAPTSGGYAFAVFTPTSAIPVVTVQATALGITGQNVLQLACASQPVYTNPVTTQPVVSQPVVQQPAAPAPPQQTLGVAPAPIFAISPPNTGDGGLAAD